MLANLDNEVHFKNVFTDVEVFTGFVKDVLGIDLQIDKVETEKVLDQKVSAIKFRMDLFAEDKQNRTIVELQKVDYDYSYDRFSHYFLGNLVDTQRSSKNYTFGKQVYVIVLITSAYRISEKNGKPIKDGVLVTDINPRTLNGVMRDMHDHKMVILNTVHAGNDTPQDMMDWITLIRESMNNPENPHINTQKSAIAKAAQLAEINNIDPAKLHEAKIQEMRKEAGVLREDMAVEKAITESIQNALASGFLNKEQIATIFKVSVEYVEEIERQMAK